jgi:replicative DNA helicase
VANRPVNGADPATKGPVRLGRREAESWPCDPDLERSLLGVCLWGKAREVVQALEAQDLAVSAHGEIFGAIASLVEQGEATFDVWTLASELRHRGSLDSIGGVAYLADLDRGIVVEQDVGLRSKKLRGLANRRRLLHVSDELQRRAADLTEPLADTKAWLGKVLNALD